MLTKDFAWPTPNELTQKALKLSKALHEKGFLVYWAGGCVRDSLLNRTPKDIDLATNASPDEIQALFPKNIAIGKQFGVITVPLEDSNFEIATFRTDGSYKDGRRPDSIQRASPQEDAERRDFTANALFWDPFKAQIIDYVGGLQDLDKKVIRAIGLAEKRFEEDKLRIMRGLRFSAEFRFEIEKKTSQAIKKFAKEIHQVSMERIRDELTKMLTGFSPETAIKLMDSHGLLHEVLPEVELFKGVEQPPEYHPEGDVWTHVCLMLSHCSYSPLELVLGVLFHDIAKPQTFTRGPDRIRFHGHEVLGVQMTEDILTRLKFSNKTIETVMGLVGQHMKFGSVQKMKKGKLKNFVMQDYFQHHLDLHRIDCMSSHGLLDNYELCLRVLEELKNMPSLPKPLVTGHDLITLGLKPSPYFKEILSQAWEAQLEGRFSTKDEGLLFIKEIIK